MKTVIYLNTAKPRKVLSNMTFREETVYQAHTADLIGRLPYVKKQLFDDLMMLAANALSEDIVERFKEQLGE